MEPLPSLAVRDTGQRSGLGRKGACALLVATLLGPSVGRAEHSGALRLGVHSGYDSNARRDYNGASPQSDAMGSLLLGLEGRYVHERLGLWGSYDGGVRKFLQLSSENLLTQAGNLEASWLFGRAFSLGLEAAGKDRRGGERDYSDLQSALLVDFSPDPRLTFQVRGGAQRFLYWPDLASSFAGSVGGLNARYRLNRRHTLLTQTSMGKRRYGANARAFGGTQVLSVRREDSVLEGGVGYGYRGPFAFNAQLSYAQGDSNSYGESWRRRRLGLTLGAPLFFSLTLLVQLQLQRSSYPDGLFLSPELILQQDEENSNALSVKLTRPLTERLDVELRGAAYQNRLRGGTSGSDAEGTDLRYLRQVASVGFTFRL